MNPTFQGQEWLVLVNRDERRMMSTREVQAQLRAGTLARGTLVWRTGMEAWASIDSIAELASQNARPTLPRGRTPDGYNPRLAETIASNHRIARQYATQRAAQSRRLTLDLIGAGAAALLAVAATSYALYRAGAFQPGGGGAHAAAPASSAD
jgi:hypothetical protein